MIYTIIGCLIIIGFLGYKLYQKQTLDTKERDRLKDEVKDLRNLRQYAEEDLKLLKEKTDYEKHKLEECKKDLQTALDTYNDITSNKLKEIDASIEEQRQKRQEDLDNELKNKKELYNKLAEEAKQKCEKDSELYKQTFEALYNELLCQLQEATEQADFQKQKYESLLAPIRQYEMEKQQKLYYTIQLPEEYRDDIEFLLTTVATKVQHPDIISKLVWAEYVKPNLDNTFKRIEIRAEPGIYKLTSLENGMSYIGKSTNVKNRIQDHFKSSIGIKSIADQAVHHAILKEGFWNWSIEVITYADKDKLNELEKYYIEFFKTQEFGYNKNSGGGG